jgi:hypothetical protein
VRLAFDDAEDADMAKLDVTLPQIFFIAGTRGALGLGAGLLLSSKLPDSRRRALGLGLIAFGVATTIPAARWLFARHSPSATGS